MPQFTVKLACGRFTLHPHTDGDVQCHHWHGWQKIVGHYAREWRARCVTGKCRFNSWCGQSEMVADAAARRHQKYRGAHQVVVKYDSVGSPSSVDVLRLSVLPSEEHLPVAPDRSHHWYDDLPEPPY